MFFFIVLHYLFLKSVLPCSNFLASSGATTDGSTFVTYTCDGFGSWGHLYLSKAQDWPNGTMILGKIPQVHHTYNVVGNVNEKGVSFGETTWSVTREGLTHQTNAIIDYDDLMWIILQRSATAREAIINIGLLLDEFGWKSEDGESFSIADPNEVWMMEVVGKGDFEQPKLGAVWVALKIPDGYVGAHANQARIQTFPLNDPSTSLYAKDTISFARARGWYSGPDEDFSFSDVYGPVTFEGARWGEARVYSMFNKLVEGGMEQYLDYAQGINLKNRMPLFVKPKMEVNMSTVLWVMRDHYENTWFDMLGEFDVGNQPFYNGDRFLPLKWKASNGKTYVFERPISIQKTGSAFIMQMRKWLPEGLSTIQWFSFDDTATNCFVPLFSTLQTVPAPFGHFPDFSFDSAFWMLNMVANFAYSRYEAIYPEVKAKQSELELWYINEIAKTVDPNAEELYKESGKEAMYEYLHGWSLKQGEEFIDHWKLVYGDVFQKFYDGGARNIGYNQKWYDYIAEKTGDHFLYHGDDPL